MATDQKKIQSQLTQRIVVVYVVTTLLAFASVYYVLDSKVQELGEIFSIQYLLKERSIISSPIEKEVALALKMADTEVIREWALDEENDFLRELALRELENYRQHFHDRSYFFIINESKNYYYNDQDGLRFDEHYRYTLDEHERSDQWYFSTMASVDQYALNVNVDRVLETTKVWINAIVYDHQGQKIGLAGTGITLDVFLDRFIKGGSHYITPLLLDGSGFIMAYEDEDYIQLAALLREQAVVEKTIFELIGSDEIEQVREAMEQLKLSHAQSGDNNRGNEAAALSVAFGEEERIAALSYIPAIDWFIVVLFNTSEIFNIWDFMPTMLVLFLALLAISLTIMYFIGNMVINPINALTASSLQLAEKKYQHRLQIDSNNEFGLLAHSFNDMAEKILNYTTNLEQLVAERTKTLKQTNAELAVKNQKLMDNISYASYLQQSILPDQHLLESAMAEHFVLWQPKDVVGGDFYWLKEQEEQLLIAVIDCTGHGVPGALMTMTANAVLNRIVDTEITTSPAMILKRYDEVMRETLCEDTDEFQRDDGLDIALCAIETSSGRITFAGARMDLFYVDLESLDGVRHVKGDRGGIGYQLNYRKAVFTDHRIEAKSPIVYLTSDGYLDQNGGAMNKRYSRNEFISLLQRNFRQSLAAQGNSIKEELEIYMGEEPQRDDITVVGFRPSR